MNLVNVYRTNDNSKIEGNQYNKRDKKSIELEYPLSSPTRFSAKKRNARYSTKKERTPEPSCEVQEAIPVEPLQIPVVETVDTTPAQTVLASPAPEPVATHVPAVATPKSNASKPVATRFVPTKKKRGGVQQSARKGVRFEKRAHTQADPAPEERTSRPVSAGRKKLEVMSVAAILACALLSLLLVNRPSQKTLVFGNNQVTYTGTTIQGKMNGQGKMTFENGDTYEGEFADGYFQGQGTYTSVDGWVYEGQFVKGQADGQGKLTTQDNIVYEGTFKQGIYQSAN